MPRLTHIAETALYVDDLPRAVQFYTALFACPVLLREERLCSLGIADGQVLLLFRRGASLEPAQVPGGMVPGHNGIGPLHVCFGIDAADLAEWEQRLQRLGVEIESHVDWPKNAVSLYFRDPDGHALELATPGLWDTSALSIGR